MSFQSEFLKQSEINAFDKTLRQKINFNIAKYSDTVKKGKQQYQNIELAKKRASYIKWKVLERLDEYLLEFESNFSKNGGKLIWAADKNEARSAVLKILKQINAKSVVKAKSMTSEEIELNELLSENNIDPIETDLGEYIVQLSGEKPYHIVTPAMHKSKADVEKLFNENFGTPLGISAEALALTARQRLREKYYAADAGITGANFLIADTGGIAITENEGNARLAVSFPKVHIAIAGFEKIIPSIDDLDLFWHLLATHGTGQYLTVYNSIINGARKDNEKDGPEAMYLILLDNGRSGILSDPVLRQSLSCIRCGACLNVCPVYKNIGGHNYQTTYSGPIGSVISPHMRGVSDFKHLSFASSLCGNCTEVCPVKIDLHKLLLYNRKISVDKGMNADSEKWMWFFWKKLMLNRKRMDKGGKKIKNWILKTAFKNSWNKRRTFPHIAEKSFHKLWGERSSRSTSD